MLKYLPQSLEGGTVLQTRDCDVHCLFDYPTTGVLISRPLIALVRLLVRNHAGVPLFRENARSFD